jgi:peptidoglycan hydrolase CwlO-like protein
MKNNKRLNKQALIIFILALIGLGTVINSGVNTLRHVTNEATVKLINKEVDDLQKAQSREQEKLAAIIETSNGYGDRIEEQSKQVKAINDQIASLKSELEELSKQ